MLIDSCSSSSKVLQCCSAEGAWCQSLQWNIKAPFHGNASTLHTANLAAIEVIGRQWQPRTTHEASYNLRPRRPPFLLVESVGIGVTSSADKRSFIVSNTACLGIHKYAATTCSQQDCRQQQQKLCNNAETAYLCDQF